MEVPTYNILVLGNPLISKWEYFLWATRIYKTIHFLFIYLKHKACLMKTMGGGEKLRG